MSTEGLTEYFDDLDARVQSLRMLNDQGQEDEALLLCCAYLDGLAGLRYPKSQEQSHRNFVRLLCEHSNDPRLAQIHPHQLLESLAERKKKWSGSVVTASRGALVSAVGKLHSEAEILTLLSPLVSADDLQRLTNQLWRGTLASIIYGRVRCELVHSIAPSLSPHSVTLSETMSDGKPIGTLDFNFVHPILVSVTEKLRELSVKSGALFGHGFR